MTPAISVIVPAYNRAQELERALQSLAAQTERDFEVIVCDDGSTEDLAAVVHRFENTLDVRYLRIDNSGGPARPRNRAAALATGSWLSFLDSDDWWDANRMARVLPHLHGPARFVYHRLRVQCSPMLQGRRDRRSVIGDPLSRDALEQMLLAGNPIPNSASLVRRDAFESIGGFCEDKLLHALEDFDAWLRLVRSGVQPLFINEILGNYWIGADGISRVTPNHVLRQEALFARHADALPGPLGDAAVARQHFVLATMLLGVGGREARVRARAHLRSARGLHGTTMKVKRWLRLLETFRP